jgi:hypothetical protein
MEVARVHHRRLCLALSFAVLSSGVVGCNLLDGGRDCTLVGCVSGLMVQFDGALPPGPLTVELLPFGPAAESRYVFQCADTATCPAAFFPGVFEEREIQIRVTTARGSVVRSARPRYERTRPNGPDCEPTCFNGVVRVAPPA